jgi:hypothetical protein
MKLRIGIGVFFLAASILVAGFLYNSIITSANESEAIEQSEIAIKEKLLFIKLLQESHYDATGAYAKDWKALKKFCSEEILYRTQRREEVITLYYGADSVAFHIDTLASKNVRDSLFQQEINPNKYAIQNLQDIPLSEAQFRLDLGFTSGIDVYQITDTDPKNKRRTYGIQGFDTLRMGSLTQPAIKGNWEK